MHDLFESLSVMSICSLKRVRFCFYSIYTCNRFNLMHSALSFFFKIASKCLVKFRAIAEVAAIILKRISLYRMQFHHKRIMD